MKFELPRLPYSYDALEPCVDARTMELHHAKHHQAYVNKLNEAIGKHPELGEKSLEELLASLDSVPEDIRGAVRNHGGGHFNHSLFWKAMAPIGSGGGGEPGGALAGAIRENFGDIKKFREVFSSAASGIFGSGWAWIVAKKISAIGARLPDGQGSASGGKNGEKKLLIITTPNQDSPISSGLLPILGLDVWEHAYYLKYQNRRQEYIDAWWNIVNWEEAGRLFNETS